jgi:hypothetical protein
MKCICHNDLLEGTRSAFIKGNIYEYSIYNNGKTISLGGTFIDFEGFEYVADKQALSIDMFTHYFRDLEEHRDLTINTLLEWQCTKK